MKNIILVITAFCILSVGCKHNESVDASGSEFSNNQPPVLAYFCVPHHLESCLPLVIYNTSQGWRARYGGSADTAYLKLKPINTGKKEMVAFDEYVEGKLNGHYLFDFDGDYKTSYYYTKHNSGDTTYFYVTYIYDPSILCRNIFDVDDDLFYEECSFDCQRALLQAYCNPQWTLQNGVYFGENDENAEKVGSPDGKVRINSTHYHILGNGHGTNIPFAILQYDDGKGVSTLSDFETLYYFEVMQDIPERMNFGHMNDYRIHQVKIKGVSYYLIETTPRDESPLPISFYYPDDVDNPNRTQVALEWSAIVAYQICNGKFCPAPIFAGKSAIVAIAADATTDMHFVVDARNGIIKVPHVSTTDYVFTGTYDIIQMGL